MAPQTKAKKTYQKPSVTRVKLEIDESVLAACKHFNGDSTGKNAKYCGANSCKTEYGS